MDVQSHPHLPPPPPPPPASSSSHSQPTDLNSVEKFDAMSFASRMSSFDQTCSCCPYGYHIDLDFLRYLDSLHNSSDTLKKLKKIRYGKGGGSLPRSVKSLQQQAPHATQTSPRCSSTTVEKTVTSQVTSTSPKFSFTIAENLVTSQLTSASQTKCSSTTKVENIVTCSTSRRSGKEVLVELDITPSLDGATTILSSPETTTNPVSPDSKYRTEAELFISDSSSIESRESSIHVVEERHETTSRSVHAESFSRRPLELPVPERPVHPVFTPHPEDSIPAIPYRPFSRGSSSSPVESEASGISPAVLQAIREQMALSLRRMKELEEQVKVIPALQARISVLVRENEHLAQTVRSSRSEVSARVEHGLLDAWTQSDEESFQSEFRMIRDHNATRERRDFDVNCNRVAEEDDVVAVVNVVGVSSMVGENRAREGRFYSVAIQCQLLTDGVRSEGGIKEEMTSVAVDVRPSVISRCVGTDDGFLWYPADNTTHDISMGNPSISTLGNPEQRLAWWMKLGVDKSTSVDETLWNGVEFQTNEVHDAREVDVLEERQNIVIRTERVQLASPQGLTTVVPGEAFAIEGDAGPQQRDVGFKRRLEDVDSGEDSTEDFEFSDRSFEFETAASFSQSDDSRKPWPVKSEGAGNVGDEDVVVVEKAVGGGGCDKLPLEREMELTEESDVSLKNENFVVTADGVWLEKESEGGGERESLTSKLISEAHKEGSEIQDENISNADKKADDKSEEIYAANEAETNDEEKSHAGKEAENKNAEILGVDETTKHEERDFVELHAALKNKDEGEALGDEEIVEITPQNEDKPSIEAASNKDQSKTEFFLVVDQIVKTPMLESKRGTMSLETNLEVLLENEVENQEDQEISAAMSLDKVEQKQDDQGNSAVNVDLGNSDVTSAVISTQATVSASEETVIFNQRVRNEDKSTSEVLNEDKDISEVGNEDEGISEVGIDREDESEVAYEGKYISEIGNENKGVSEVGNEDGGVSDTGEEIEVKNENISVAEKETERENEEPLAASEESRNEDSEVVALEVAIKNNDGGVLVENQEAEIKVGETKHQSSAYNEEIESEDKKSLNEQTEPKETEEILREDKFPNEDTLDTIRESEKRGGEEISDSDSDMTRTDEESGGSYEIDWATRGDNRLVDEETGVTTATEQEITRSSMIERNESAVVVEAHEGTSSPRIDFDDDEITKSLSQAAVIAIDTRVETMETEVTVDHGKEVVKKSEEGKSEVEVSEEKISDVIVSEEKESEVNVSEETESQIKLPKEEISEVRVPEEKEPEVKVSEEIESEVKVSEEGISEVRVPEEKESEVKISNEEKYDVGLPRENESEVKVSEEIESHVKVPEEEKSQARLHQENESELKVPDVKVSEEIESQVKVSNEEISEVGEPAEKESEVRESKEEKSEVRLPREKESEVNVSEEMESEVKVSEEIESQVNISKKVISEERAPEEREFEIKVPQEKKSEVNVLVEIEFEVNVPKEKMSEVRVPDEEESGVLVSEGKESDVKMSKEELSEVGVPEDKESEVRVPEIEIESEVQVSHDEKYVVRVPEESESEVNVCKEDKSKLKLPDEGESEVRVSDDKESEEKLIVKKECEAGVSEQNESEVRVSKEEEFEASVCEEKESDVRLSERKISEEIESHVKVAKETDSEVTVLEENGSVVKVKEENKTEIIESQDSKVDESKKEIKSEIFESEEPESEMKKSEEMKFEEKETEDWELVEKVSVVKELNTDKSATLDSKENKVTVMVSKDMDTEICVSGEKEAKTMESETKELEEWELVDKESYQKEDRELVGSSVGISERLLTSQVPSVDHIEMISTSDNSHELIVVSETELCQLAKVEQEPSNSSREPVDQMSREPVDQVSREPAEKVSRETADQPVTEPADQVIREPTEEVSREPVDQFIGEPEDQIIVEPVSGLVDNGSFLVSGLPEGGEVAESSVVCENVEQARLKQMTGKAEAVDRETTSREIELTVKPAKSIESDDDVGIVLDTSVEPEIRVVPSAEPDKNVPDTSVEPEKSSAASMEPDTNIVLETNVEPDKNISFNTGMEPCTSMQLDENLVPYTDMEPDKGTQSYTSVEPAAREPVDREPADRVPADREPSDREPVDREPADREPVDREPVETEDTKQSDTTFSETSNAESSSDVQEDSSENGSSEFHSIESNNSSSTKRVVITESRVERRRGEQRESSSHHASKEIDSGELEKAGRQTEGGDAEDGSAAVKKTIDSRNPTSEEAQAAADDDDSHQISVEHQDVVVRPDVLAACAVYAEYLRDPTVAVDSDNVVSCVDFLRGHWFELSGRKTSDANQVQVHLDEFQTFGTSLAQSLVNMADSDGNTAMHYAVSYGNMEVIDILLNTGFCSVDKQNKAGYTSIMLASLLLVDLDQHESLVLRLFHSGDVNSTSATSGQTSLMLAASHGRSEMVALLLQSGAEINLQDEDGSTALMCASEHGHSDVIRTLLSHPDCDSTITDVDGSTALSIAMEEGHHDIGVFLYAHMKAIDDRLLEEPEELD